MYASGFRPTLATLNQVRAHLHSDRTTPVEKVALARILGLHHGRPTLEDQSPLIRDELAKLAQDEEAKVVQAAVLSYVALGHDAQSTRLLLSARARGMIDDDLLYGELARFLGEAPVDEGTRISQMLLSAGNRYSVDVLAASLHGGHLTPASLPPQAWRALSQLLRGNEPAFSVQIDRFGMIEAIRYNQWAWAAARVDGLLEGLPPQEVLVRSLGATGMDPRKSAAVLMDDAATALYADPATSERAKAAARAVQEAFSRFPASPGMKDALSLMASRMPAR